MRKFLLLAVATLTLLAGLGTAAVAAPQNDFGVLDITVTQTGVAGTHHYLVDQSVTGTERDQLDALVSGSDFWALSDSYGQPAADEGTYEIIVRCGCMTKRVTLTSLADAPAVLRNAVSMTMQLGHAS
ncbi:hypothetical protein D5S17_12315 [Pseudonocardiaceae bacterium YIM PH 21723]|nr:hypothetical protein D5S17_12315 [Pseudonocardiaceae bacterium YIM PH 21723]